MDKLLLIDDEADMHYSFRRIFESPDIELTSAYSGEEGLRLLSRFRQWIKRLNLRRSRNPHPNRWRLKPLNLPNPNDRRFEKRTSKR